MYEATSPRVRQLLRQTDRQTSLYVLFEMYMYVVCARFVDLDQVPTHRWTYLRCRLSPERKSPCWNGKLTVEVALRSRRATHRNSTHKEQKHDAYIRTDNMSQHAIQGDGHERKENECVILFRIAVSTSPRVFHRFFMPLRLCHSLSLSLSLSLSCFFLFLFLPPLTVFLILTCLIFLLAFLESCALACTMTCLFSSTCLSCPPYPLRTAAAAGALLRTRVATGFIITTIAAVLPIHFGATQNPATERAMRAIQNPAIE